MNRFLRTLVPFFGLAVCTVSPAAAQRISSPYRFIEHGQELGVFVAHIKGDAGEVGLGPESGLAFGARYGLRMAGPFRVEAEVSYFPTTTAVLDTVVVDSAFRRIGTADRALVIGTAAIRLNLTGPRTWNRIQPSLLFGVGGVLQASSDKDAVNAAPTDARYDFGTSLAGILGAGIAIVPTDRLAIRLDGRNLLWKLKTPAALLRGNTGRVIPTDEWAQNISASIGVSFLF